MVLWRERVFSKGMSIRSLILMKWRTVLFGFPDFYLSKNISFHELCPVLCVIREAGPLEWAGLPGDTDIGSGETRLCLGTVQGSVD